jgi:GTP-binding protein
MLANHKKLAKTSGTPGKTQLINHFLIDKTWFLVDLPGYGYAKVSKTDRARWETFIRQYFLERPNLMCAFVLLDCRLEPQKKDLEFMQWLGSKGIPFVMTFTKIDKLNSGQLSKNLQAYKKEMLKEWEFLPDIITTSAEGNLGRNEILNLIERTNPLYKS